MAISDRLNKLTTDITNAYTSIENKGGTIPANKNTNNLPTAIDSIEVIETATAEGESLSLVNTKAMPYSDYVVEGKSEQATRSGKNLLNVTATTRTMNGVTITVNQDKSITLNGTNTSSETIFYRLADNFNLPAGTYTLSNHNNNVSNNNFIFYDDNYNFEERYNVVTKTFNTQKTIKPYLKVAAGITLNNEIIYPMIEKNSFMTDYEPYGASPSPDYPSEIHSVADDVNLFDINSITEATYINSAGDTGTSTVSNLSDYMPIKANNTYSFQYDYSQLASGGIRNYCLYNNNKTWLSGYSYVSTNKVITFTPTQDGYVRIAYDKNCTDIKLAKATTLTPYSPYNQGTVTIKQRGTTENNDYTIQTEPLRSLPNGVKDTIEAEQHRKIGTYIFDGTEYCINYANSTYAFAVFLPVGIPDIKHLASVDRVLCSHLQHTILDNIYSKRETQDNNLISTQGTRSFAIMINNYTSTTELQTYLAQQYANGTPVTIQYELAEEIIEPLTQNQATTMLDITHTGSYEDTTNIYTDEDVKPTIEVDYYKKA